MADENKMQRAKQVYQTLCDAIEKREWNFARQKAAYSTLFYHCKSPEFYLFFAISHIRMEDAIAAFKDSVFSFMGI